MRKKDRNSVSRFGIMTEVLEDERGRLKVGDPCCSGDLVIYMRVALQGTSVRAKNDLGAKGGLNVPHLGAMADAIGVEVCGKHTRHVLI
jgi:hypothetical protein